MNGILKDANTSQKIKALMGRRGLRQNDIAKLLNLTTETIRQRIKADRWEIGELKKIADAYRLDISDLI